MLPLSRYVELSKWLTAHHMPPPALPIVCGYAPLIEKLENALFTQWEADTRVSPPEVELDEHNEAVMGEQETVIHRPQRPFESDVEDNGEGPSLKTKQEGSQSRDAPLFDVDEFIEAAFKEDQVPVVTTPGRSFSRVRSNRRKGVKFPQKVTGDVNK